MTGMGVGHLGQHFGAPAQLFLLKPEEVYKLQQHDSGLSLEVWLGG